MENWGIKEMDRFSVGSCGLHGLTIARCRYKSRGMEKSTNWNFGEKAKLARAAGVLPQHLSQIMKGDRPVSVRMARKLEEASIRVLGLRRAIPAAAWAGFEEHPALVRGKMEEVGV